VYDRVKELGPGDVADEKAISVGIDDHDDSSLAQQNSALAMLRSGNVSQPHALLYTVFQKNVPLYHLL